MPQPEELRTDDAAHGLSNALRRNIKALEVRRSREAAILTREERVITAITSFTGSMWFVYLHLCFCTVWIVVNLGVVTGFPRFDPSLSFLAMVASVEAIFLSTFVLISQNRMVNAADKRADLDLHINLLTEHELTKLTEMVEAIAAHFDIKTADHPELDEIKKDVALETVLDEIEAQQQKF
jgi:uncharacterized membrane protein